MLIGGVALELARAYLDKSDTAAVVRIHIGMNLEHETAEGIFLWLDHTFESGHRSGFGRNFHEAVEHFLDTECIESRAEEYGSRASGKVIVDIEFGIDTFNQLKILAQFGGINIAHGLVDARIVDIVDLDAFGGALFVGCEEVEALFIDIIDALEFSANIYRPRQRTDGYLQFGLQLVENFEWITTFAVELVDEYDDRGIAHAAYLHEFAGLGLDTLGHVDHYDNAVDSRKSAVSVFGEVLVTGCIENVDLIIAVIETHDRSGNRNAALLFDLHPVGCGRFFDLVRFHGTGDMDSTAEKKQLLGQSGLTRVRVRYDGEGASPFYFFV